MRDKRKFLFITICILLTVLFELHLFNEAKKADIEYKAMLEKKLSVVVKELENRSFESKTDYKKGILEFERQKDEYDYGYIYSSFDINGDIDDLEAKLEYSDDSYIEDVFYDAFYVLNLLDLNLDNTFDYENDLADNFSVSKTFTVNETNYTLEITKTPEESILFEIK